jgi:hypothetical protein
MPFITQPRTGIPFIPSPSARQEALAQSITKAAMMALETPAAVTPALVDEILTLHRHIQPPDEVLAKRWRINIRNSTRTASFLP